MFKKCISIFGLTEIAIGTATFIAVTQSLNAGISTKPLNVLVFVVLSSLISALLGAGVLIRQEYSRKLFIFFAGWIILSKILIFAKIIFLNGALETTIPSGLKGIISIFYHSLLICYFIRPSVRRRFA